MFHNILTSTSRSPKLSLPSRFSYFFLILTDEKNHFKYCMRPQTPNSTTINLNTCCPQRLQGARRVSAPIRQQTVPDMCQRSRKGVCSRNSPVSRGLRLLCVWKNVCPRATGNLRLSSWIIRLLSFPEHCQHGGHGSYISEVWEKLKQSLYILETNTAIRLNVFSFMNVNSLNPLLFRQPIVGHNLIQKYQTSLPSNKFWKDHMKIPNLTL